jgi:L-lactate dehydrogenase complex protein LldE
MMVSLFIPCIVDQWLPNIGVSTVELLRHIGCKPFYHDEQTCCGQMLYNSGQTDLARKLARRFIEIFEQDEAIVCPSASCVHMVRINYPILFESEPVWQRRANDLAKRFFELSEYIVDQKSINQLGAAFEGKVAFHESCSQLRLRISDHAKRLLNGVEGIELLPMKGADVCCGFGGRFSIEYPEISNALVSEKVANFIASGTDMLVLCEPGCLLNIAGCISRNCPEKQVVHIATFLSDHLSN